MASEVQRKALTKIRSAILSGRHQFPSAIHRSLQVPHTKKKTNQSSLNAIDILTQRQGGSSETSFSTMTPEARRPLLLSALDEVTKSTSEGGVGLGKRDHVINLGRGMYVPVELVSQKIRQKFWYRI